MKLFPQMRHSSTFWLNFFLPLILALETGCATVEQLRCLHHTEKQPPFSADKLKPCFGVSDFTYPASNVSHNVYCIGSDRSKPPVILLHELPGLSGKTLEYAENLSEDFTVYVPMLFGELNQNSTFRGISAFLFNGEWGWPLGGSNLDRNTLIVRWLRGLVSEIERQHDGHSIGVIGNCLTGSLPLLLLDNANVNAVVLAQPTLPMRFIHYSEEDRRSLGISESELDAAKRLIEKKDIKIYGVRFAGDCVSSRKKQDTLGQKFGVRYENAEIEEAEYKNPPECRSGDCSKAHSTLIGEWQPGSASEWRRQEVRKYLKNPSTFTRHPVRKESNEK
ncbi:hypothetical protein [Nitrosospira multiformis]|uniref:Dienelactone hydrolase n=1 Tax=Nitrosospira multiformis TaxID=1231 RepID=A0A1I7I1N5_9PROT|nr:hypothetical protein [Nitrosospira multiformis]SFU66872.1 Dienelactone hydrolase [Nitrosospira multiformis]